MADLEEQDGGLPLSLKRKYESEDEEDLLGKDETSMDFSCPHCEASFVTRMSLTRHMILHEDEHEEGGVEGDEGEESGQGEYSNHDEIQDTQESTDSDSPMLESLLMQAASRMHAAGQQQQMNGGEMGELSDDRYEESDVTPTPAKVPKLLKSSRPIPNLKPLPPLIPTADFQAAVQKKEFQCELCSVYFNKKEDLARHVTRTHGGARFTCPYCSRNISRRDHLKRHIKNVHPEYCTDTEIGPFLADPSASRAAKEQHAEHFVAQYGLANVNSPEWQTEKHNGVLVDNDKIGMQNFHLLLQSYNNDDHPSIMEQYEENNDLNPSPKSSDNEFEEGGSMNGGESPEDSQRIHFEGNVTAEMDDESNEQSVGEQNEYMTEGDESQANSSLAEHLGNGFSKGPVERKYKCDMCEAAFMSNVNLQRHMSTHSIVRPHKCTICGKGFLRKEHLTKHLSSVHSGMKFTCKFCGKDISRKDHLLRHIRNCHPIEFMGMPPDQLQAETSQASQPVSAAYLNLGSQQRAQGAFVPKPTVLACDICYETFNHIDELHEHQSSVHTDVWRFKCQHCPKAFKRKEHLSKHEVLHSGLKRFSCSKCGKVFSRKEAAMDHIRNMHTSSAPAQGQASFPCNLCDSVFSQKPHLSQHLKSYHGVSTPKVDPRMQAVGGVPNVRPAAQLPARNIRQQTASQVQRVKNHRNQSLLIKNKHLHQAIPRQMHAPKSEANLDLGSLMGLINRGSLSLSRVTSTVAQQ